MTKKQDPKEVVATDVGKPVNAKKLIEAIESARSVDEVNALVGDDQRKTVIAAKDSKIKSLNESTKESSASAGAAKDAQDQSESNSGQDTPEIENDALEEGVMPEDVAETLQNLFDANPGIDSIEIDQKIMEAYPELTNFGMEEGDQIRYSDEDDSIAIMSKEEVQKEIEEDNIAQAKALGKLKAIAYNPYPGNKYKRLAKHIPLKDLDQKSKLPSDINYHSEVLMDNGQIFTPHEGLTNRFDKESVKFFTKEQ